MNIYEIEQAIKELSLDELALFRHWFEEFERGTEIRDSRPSPPIEETLKKLRGSLKGKGLLKALMEERHKN